MEIIQERHKYHFVVFSIVLIATTMLGYLGLAYNPDEYQDTDGDGLTDYQEKAIYQTFWYEKDTDGDGYDDGTEVANGYSPKQKGLKMIEADTDNDGLNDQWEILLGSNLMVRDTDKDGYLDGSEVYDGFSPTDPNPIKVEKRIEVDIEKFTLKYYQGNVLLDEFLVSTGKPSTPTPRGEFKVIARYDVKNYYHYPNTKWNLHFTTNPNNNLRYYIHGAYWHNLFGQKNVSGGCVNVPYAYMERLYKWANEGTKVIIK